MKHISLVAVILAVCFASPALAQVSPDMAQGLSPYATYIPSDIDNVNPINGNLFLKIPIVSFPQRGGKLRLDYYIYYNDKQWQLSLSQAGPNAYTGYWNLGDPSSSTGFSPTAGAYIARDQYAQSGEDSNVSSYTYGGASYEQFTLTTQIFSNYVMTMDGGKHYVGDGFYQTCTSQGGGICPAGLPSYARNSYMATDGSGFDQNGHDPDGIIYTPQAGGLPYNVSDVNGNRITAANNGWTDTFGKLIPGTLTGPGALPFPNSPRNPSPGVNIWDLTPGTPAGSVPAQCPSGTSAARFWQLPGSTSYGSGYVTYYMCYTYYSYQTAFNLASILPAGAKGNAVYYLSEASSSGSGSDGQALMLTAIVLPDGNSYTFAYDQYLSLTQLTLPSGATIQYNWQNILFNTSLSSTSAPVSRALHSRTIIPGNGQPSSTTTYSWNINYGSSGAGGQYPAYSIITDANGNDEEHTLGGVDDAGSNWLGYVDLGVASYSGCSPHDPDPGSPCSPSGGTKLKAVTYALTPYSGGGAAYGTPSYIPQLTGLPPTIPSQVTTHVEGGSGEQISRVVKKLVTNFGNCNQYTYPVTMYTANQAESAIQNNGGATAPQPTYQPETSCFTTGQVTSVATYDFGAPGSGSPGALIKTEAATYTWQPPYFSGVPALSSVSVPNLLHLVNTSQVHDGSGNWAAETDYCYNGNGELTSTERFPSAPSSSSSCTAPPSNALITSTAYNSQGVATSTTDANRNTTLITAFACGAALPQNITLPDGNKEAYGYDCNTGKVTSFQDQNNITNGTSTTYTYNDPLARVTLASFPDGGSIQVNYNNDSLPLTMQVTTATGESAGPNIATSIYDGLARKIHSQVTDSPSSSISDIIHVDTNYDALGRVEFVSNPYRTSQDATYGVTTYSYDALGRQIQLTHPDNSFQTWSYNGPTVTFKDESGNQWAKTSDGLGRLTGVLEPNGASSSPSLPTNYSYDALGNLKTVNQIGLSGTDTARARSFYYDGISRLVATSNPENVSASAGAQLTCPGTTGKWSMCYVYDGNGNVNNKTDNRNFIATYAYDSMNRLLSKSYNSGDPSACFQYNTPITGNSDRYAKGRLTLEWTQAGSCPAPNPPQSTVPSGAISSEAVLQHDSMGRIQIEQQCPFAPCSAAYKFSYAYDLAGNVVGSNNGMPTATSSVTAPAISWGATYDAANHLSLVNVSSQPWSDTVHPPVLFQANQNTYSTLGSTMPFDPFGHLVGEQLGLTTSSSPSAAGVTMQAAYSARGFLQSKTYVGQSASGTSTVGSVGTITIGGSEQEATGSPAAAKATVTISGYERSTTYYPCGMGSCPTTAYDYGVVSLIINGTTVSTSYTQASSPSSIASILMSGVNSAGLPVTASVSGSVITLTAKTIGTAGNSITLSTSASTQNNTYFSGSSFSGSASGSTLAGGSSGGTVYDAGTVTVTIHNSTATVPWGNGSTSESLATALAAAISSADGGFLTANVADNVVSVESLATGSATFWPIQVSTTYNNGAFSASSFSFTAEGMGSGYAYAVPAAGYAPNGNLNSYYDSVMGTWKPGPTGNADDTLNRLSALVASSGPYVGHYGCWYYDSFGNRTLQSLQSSACASSYTAAVNYNANNQVNWTSATGTGFNYDAAGDVIGDAQNSYAYDGEGRLCAVKNSNVSIYQYVYDAEGHRVARGSQTSLSCPVPTGAGFTLQSQYLLDSGGDQVTELNSSGTWQHTNAFAGGILATYSTTSIPFAFHLTDPLGSRRVLANAQGVSLVSCQSLPFGDGETCTPTPTEQLFTGKERDAESGNDYFGARYFGSSMGRFLSPDSVGGSPDDPQSWNLYSYVLNNPLKNVDPDGHDVQVCDNNGHCNTVSNDAYKAAQQANNQGGLNAPTLAQVGNSKDANGNFTAVGITSTDANGNTSTVGSAKYVPGDNPGIDPYVGNNMAGLQTLGAADKVVTYAAVGTGAVYGGLVASAAAPAAAAAVGRWGLQRLAIGASSPALLNLVNRLYQAQDEIEGGTAGAVRNEVMTGEYINGGHSIKADLMISALQRLINSGELSGSDQTIAGHIISDLKNSLGR